MANRSTRRACFALLALLFALSPAAYAERGGAPQYRTRGVAKYVHQRTNVRRQFTIASYNVQNLFKYRTGDHKAIQMRNVREGRKASWLPTSQAEYKTKVERLAKTIIKHLKTPDVIALQEVENFREFKGNKSALHDLVKEIEKQTHASGDKVTYKFTNSPGFSDKRGIANAFLYRADRVRLARAAAADPLLGRRTKERGVRSNEAVFNPKSLNAQATQTVSADYGGYRVNSRPVLVGQFEIFQDRIGQGTPERVYVLNNHFKSRPDDFKPRRRAQANFTSKLVQDLVKANPNAKVVVAGDFNVDINNGGHRGQIRGLEKLRPSGSDPRTLLHNLTARLDHKQTYVYRGKPSQLDWFYATPVMERGLVDIRVPHINSPKDKTARASDHDPVVARFLGWNN